MAEGDEPDFAERSFGSLLGGGGERQGGHFDFILDSYGPAFCLHGAPSQQIGRFSKFLRKQLGTAETFASLYLVTAIGGFQDVSVGGRARMCRCA